MDESRSFPKRLRFTKLILWLGLLLGVLVLVLGVLGTMTGSAISIFGGNSAGLDLWLKLAGYGLVETLVFLRLVTLLPKRAPDVPAKIITYLYWYTFLQLLFSAVRFLLLENAFDLIFTFLEEWILLVFFYLYIVTEFRFQSGVAEYYGSSAPPSKNEWLNNCGRKFVEYMARA
ncbi:MAG: hypothetical protein KAI44_04170 [Methylococcales bacterium]|nr:hypothetical protein [Methylococcales bacterium]